MAANRTSNVRWGVTRGLFVAVLYCLWVSAVYVIRGTEPFDRQGISYAALVTTYIVVGVLAGAIVGTLRPLARSKLGAFGIGFAAAVPISGGLAIALFGAPLKWGAGGFTVVAIYAALVGLFIGSEIWKRVKGGEW
jgi:hypothetical protein